MRTVYPPVSYTHLGKQAQNPLFLTDIHDLMDPIPGIFNDQIKTVKMVFDHTGHTLIPIVSGIKSQIFLLQHSSKDVYKRQVKRLVSGSTIPWTGANLLF